MTTLTVGLYQGFPLKWLEKYSLLWKNMVSDCSGDELPTTLEIPNVTRDIKSKTFTKLLTICEMIEKRNQEKLDLSKIKNIHNVLDLASKLEMFFIAMIIVLHDDKLFEKHVCEQDIFNECLQHPDWITPYGLLQRLMNTKHRFFVLGQLEKIVAAEQKFNNPSQMILLDISSCWNSNIFFVSRTEYNHVPIPYKKGMLKDYDGIEMNQFEMLKFSNHFYNLYLRPPEIIAKSLETLKFDEKTETLQPINQEDPLIDYFEFNPEDEIRHIDAGTAPLSEYLEEKEVEPEYLYVKSTQVKECFISYYQKMDKLLPLEKHLNAFHDPQTKNEFHIKNGKYVAIGKLRENASYRAELTTEEIQAFQNQGIPYESYNARKYDESNNPIVDDENEDDDEDDQVKIRFHTYLKDGKIVIVDEHDNEFP